MGNQFYKTATVSKTSEKTVEVTRSFKAPKDFVYQAFTEPALIKQWMLGPPGWEMPICENDVREGGKYRWRWTNKAEESEFGFFGIYRLVKPLQQIVYTQTFDPGTMGGDMGEECTITTSFNEVDGQTTVITKIEYQSAGDMKKGLNTGMTDGMEMGYQRLDKLTEKVGK